VKLAQSAEALACQKTCLPARSRFGEGRFGGQVGACAPKRYSAQGRRRVKEDKPWDRKYIQ